MTRTTITVTQKSDSLQLGWPETSLWGMFWWLIAVRRLRSRQKHRFKDEDLEQCENEKS